MWFIHVNENICVGISTCAFAAKLHAMLLLNYEVQKGNLQGGILYKKGLIIRTAFYCKRIKYIYCENKHIWEHFEVSDFFFQYIPTSYHTIEYAN